MHQCCTDTRCIDVAALRASRHQLSLPAGNSPEGQQATALRASSQQPLGSAVNSPHGQSATALRASRQQRSGPADNSPQGQQTAAFQDQQTTAAMPLWQAVLVLLSH